MWVDRMVIERPVNRFVYDSYWVNAIETKTECACVAGPRTSQFHCAAAACQLSVQHNQVVPDPSDDHQPSDKKTTPFNVTQRQQSKATWVQCSFVGWECEDFNEMLTWHPCAYPQLCDLYCMIIFMQLARNWCLSSPFCQEDDIVTMRKMLERRCCSTHMLDELYSSLASTLWQCKTSW